MPSGARDLAHLREMRHQLARGLVHGLDRRAGQFELAARLERDRAAAGDVGEADDVRPIHDRLPAEQVLHAFEQRADAARALVGHRPVTFERERELLVLGADAELRLRLDAFGEPRDEFVAPSRSASCRPGHAPCRDSGGMGGDLTRGARPRAMWRAAQPAQVE